MMNPMSDNFIKLTLWRGAFSLFQEKCSSLNIVLICAFTLPENAPSRSAISQVDIQTAVAGTCTLPFSPMVMISLFINIPPYYMVMPLNCSIRLNLSERVFMSRLSFSWVICRLGSRRRSTFRW